MDLLAAVLTEAGNTKTPVIIIVSPWGEISFELNVHSPVAPVRLQVAERSNETEWAIRGAELVHSS